jgi:hypothetical protein
MSLFVQFFDFYSFINYEIIKNIYIDYFLNIKSVGSFCLIVYMSRKSSKYIILTI